MYQRAYNNNRYIFNLWNVLKYVQYIIYTRKRVSVNNMRDKNIDHN